MHKLKRMPLDTKSTVGSLLWLVGYLVAIVCLFIAIILKHNKKTQDFFDYFIAIILMFILIGEVYNHYNKDIFMHSIDTFSGKLSSNDEVILIKSSQCESCHAFLNSNVWDIISKKFMHKLSFLIYDTNENQSEIKTLLGDMLPELTHVPCIFIKSNLGLYKYEDNIYDINNLNKVLSMM